MSNRGEKHIHVLTTEGHKCILNMQVTDVKKSQMSLSVARICDAGHEVVFQSAAVTSSTRGADRSRSSTRWIMCTAPLEGLGRPAGFQRAGTPVIFPCEEDDPARPHFEESGEGFWDVGLE